MPDVTTPNIVINPTLRDLQMGLVKGNFDKEIVELFLRANPIMEDFVVLPANDGQNYTSVIRTGFPRNTWKSFYRGIMPSKGTKRQVTNTAGTLASLLQIDKDLADRSKNKAAELADEAFAHAASMIMEMADCAFYGNVAVNALKFNGLSPLYSELGDDNSSEDESAFYTLGAKQSTSASVKKLRSIWLVGHGRSGTHLFYPEGTTAGLHKGPCEPHRITTDNGGRLEVYEQEFKWTTGLNVKDFRKNVRIANIELDSLQKQVPGFDLDIGRLMEQALIRADDTGVKQVFYMSKLVYEQLVLSIRDKKLQSGFFEWADYEGKPLLKFQGVPVKKCGALETNEELVKAAAA